MRFMASTFLLAAVLCAAVPFPKHCRAGEDSAAAEAVFKASGVKPKIEYIDMPAEIRDQYQYVTEAKMDKLRRAGCPVKCRSLEDAVEDYVKGHLQKTDPYL